MANNTMDVILVLGAFAGMLTGFFAIIRYILSQGMTDREADRAERKALTDSFKAVAASNSQIAKETRQGNREAKERNGHLGEQSLQLAALVEKQNKDVEAVRRSTERTAEILSKSAIIAAEDREELLSPANQVIGRQTVVEQVVQSKT